MTDNSSIKAEFNNEARAILGRLADILIPAGDGFPSASEAGVAGVLLDEALAARPDLIDNLLRLLKEAENCGDPQQFISELQEYNPSAFGILATIVPGAYFMSGEVQRKLGYRGQHPIPIEEQDPPDYLEDGLLQSVLERGPIYRPTP